MLTINNKEIPLNVARIFFQSQTWKFLEVVEADNTVIMGSARLTLQECKELVVHLKEIGQLV